MNIFVTDRDPKISAESLPDKHVVKMPLETCQVLSIVFSHWYFDWGDDLVKKIDGTPYGTQKGAVSNHPCTQWAGQSLENCAWLIQHGCALSTEYTHRYGKEHGCSKALFEAKKTFHRFSEQAIVLWKQVDSFTRAMPEQWKYDDKIDTITAYRLYVSSKPWAPTNYLRDPSRKPLWMNYLTS